MSSIAAEEQLMDVIESAENLSDRHGSHDCEASCLVKVDKAQLHMTAASDGSDNESIQMEMDTNESSEKPLKQEQLELMDVNDDCLRAIFKQLPILDSASVADVCKRFRSIAQETFRLAKPIVRIPQDVYRRKYTTNCEIAEEDKCKVIRRASRLLRIFGQWMTVLDVDYNYHSLVRYDEKIVALIIKYCSGGSLVALKLQLTEMHKPLSGLEPIFRSLRRLDFHCCMSGGIDVSVPDWLPVIEDLTLNSDTRALWNALFKRIYKNLQRISFAPCPIDARDYEMFLNANKNIKDINIGFRGVDNYTLKLPTQVEKLKVFIHSEPRFCIDTDSFRSLEHLKSLQLRNHDGTSTAIAIIRGAVAGDIPLKHLILDCFTFRNDSESQQLCDALSKLHLDTLTLKDGWFQNVDELIHFSPKLHRLSELHLPANLRPDESEWLTVNELIRIASSFHKLQCLEVCLVGFHDQPPQDPILIDSNSFEKFVSIVRSRNNNTRLCIELDARCYKCEIPDDLAERNRHVFCVELSE